MHPQILNKPSSLPNTGLGSRGGKTRIRGTVLIFQEFLLHVEVNACQQFSECSQKTTATPTTNKPILSHVWKISCFFLWSFGVLTDVYFMS